MREAAIHSSWGPGRAIAGLFCCGLLLGESACRELWNRTLQPDPRNCIENPTACGPAEACNRGTELCEPAPVPQALELHAVEPTRGPSSGGSTVKLRGRGFLPGTTVSFGTPGTAAYSVSLDSESELRAELPASPGSCGPVPVRVSRPGGLTVSRDDLFYYSVQSVRFAAARLIAQTPSTSTVFVVPYDLDGDGHVDALATAYNHAGLDILFGNGDGTFRATPRIPTAAGPYHITVGDVNRDAIPDVAVANLAGNTVSVILGAGGGSFRAPMNLANNLAQSVHFFDVNDDTKPDLVILTQDGKLRLWTGDGAGAFTFLSETAVNAGAALSHSADVDGDGRKDLAITARTTNTLTVLRNKGDGTFTEVGSNPLTTAAASCASADFNGDGKIDLVAAEYVAGMVSVFLGRGDGTFEPRRSVPSGGASRVVSTGDINCDGFVDVAVSHLGNSQVTVLLGRGDGTFEPSSISASAPGATSALAVAIADFDQDQRPDLLIGVDGLSPTVLLAPNTSQ